MILDRLEESKNRNIQVQDSLKSVKREFEAFQQRREEDVLLAATDRQRG